MTKRCGKPSNLWLSSRWSLLDVQGARSSNGFDVLGPRPIAFANRFIREVQLRVYIMKLEESLRWSSRLLDGNKKVSTLWWETASALNQGNQSAQFSVSSLWSHAWRTSVLQKGLIDQRRNVDTKNCKAPAPAKSSPINFVPISIVNGCSDAFGPVIAHHSFMEGYIPKMFNVSQVTPLL